MSTILAPIDNAVAWLITRLFNAFSPIFGLTSGVTWLLTIVVLVVLMRLILVPLFIKQMHTQRAMTALAPKISELRKKYKGDREKLNQETMKLYQEAGVNPLMGCLPVLLQMPIFFGLFSVLRYIAEWAPVPGHPHAPISYGLSRLTIESAQHAKIFGASIADKVLFTGTPATGGTYVPVSAKVVIVIAVVISMTTTYLTVRQGMKRGMMPTGADSPMGQSQKMMAYVMPLFALTGLYWQFGLVLYWVTTNVWTLGQQFVLLRKYPIGAAVAAGGAAGKPATAPGLMSRTTRRKPSGGGAGKAPADGEKDAGKTASKGSGSDEGAGAEGKAATSGKPADSSASGGGASLSKPGTSEPQTAAESSNGYKPGGGEGGMLRRLGRGRQAPEPPTPAQPETKIVRHQPQRQSRSKRSGKR